MLPGSHVTSILYFTDVRELIPALTTPIHQVETFNNERDIQEAHRDWIYIED